MPDDLDITIELHLHPLLAWYGVSRRIQGIGGKELLVEIPAGIRNKTRLRLKGEGKKVGIDEGDLYLKVQIECSNLRLLQRGLLALVCVAIGIFLIWHYSSSQFYDIWLVVGYLMNVIGIIVLTAVLWKKYLGKREVGGLIYVFLCVGPPLIINNFLFDIAFSWFAAFTCATIGGTIGGLLAYPKPVLPSLIGGLIAGNISLTAIYYHTLYRTTIWYAEIVILLLLGCLPGLGIGWLLKNILSNSSSGR